MFKYHVVIRSSNHIFTHSDARARTHTYITLQLEAAIMHDMR